MFAAAAQAQVTAAAGRAIPVDVAEEKLTSYEAGLKGEFFNRKLRIMSAAYYAQWRDRQVTSKLPYIIGTTTSTSSVIFSSGSVNLMGVALEGTFNWAGSDIRNTSCLECLAIGGNANPVGNQMERVPAFTWTAAASYERKINRSWTAFSRLDYIHTGRQYATGVNVVYTDSADRFNLRVGLRNEVYSLEICGACACRCTRNGEALIRQARSRQMR